MNLFSAFFYRRLVTITHNWVGELSISLLLPIGIYSTLGFGLSNSTPSLEYFPKLSWLIPGIILIISFAGALITIFNDIMKNKRITSLYGTLYASPSSLATSVFGITSSVLPEGIARAILGLIILEFIIGYAFSALGQILFLFLIIFSTLIGASIGLTLGILSKNSLSNQLVILLLLIGLGFCSGWFVPLEVFPESIQTILKILPTTVLGECSRAVLFGQIFPFSLLFIPVGTIGIFFLLNILLFPIISTE